MTTERAWCLRSIAAWTLLSCVAWAQEQPAAKTPTKPPAQANDPAERKFEEIVGQAAAFLSKAPAYQVDVDVKWTVGEASGVNRFVLQREGAAAFRIEVRPGDAKEPALVSAGDGKSTVTWFPANKLYSVHATDPKDPFLRHNAMLAQAIEGSGIELLLHPHVTEFVGANVDDIRDLGLKDRAGKKAHGFSMRWGHRLVEAWVAAEGPPVLIGFRRTSEAPRAVGETSDDAPPPQVLDATLVWKLDPKFKPGAFALKPPGDAKKVYDIYAELIREDDSEIVGKPTPKLEVTTLDGDRQTIGQPDEKKRPQVVILWASWCAPAVKQLAGVSKFVEEQQALGARFLAVNVEEDLRTVQEFVAKHKPKSEIALDRDGHIVDALGVTHLPAVLVIDGEGIVRALHEDVSADVLKELAADLEKLRKVRR